MFVVNSCHLTCVFCRYKCNDLFQFVARIQPHIVLRALVHGVFPSITSGRFMFGPIKGYVALIPVVDSEVCSNYAKYACEI